MEHQDRSQFEGALAFLKGHGTGNDFVIIPDLSGDINLNPNQVVELCDRHFGIGADGVLRVVPSRLMPASVLEISHVDPAEAMYFMDYRNADGSIAETCGNGIRVFAHYLVTHDLVASSEFIIGTRAGMKTVTYTSPDRISVTMGMADFQSELNGVQVTTELGSWSATAVAMPNPHCVSVVSNQSEAGALHNKPTFSPIGSFVNDANFEFITPLGEYHFAMRTYERGVGETLSCGSGATAAAATFAALNELQDEWSVQVDVLGGTVWVSRNIIGELVLTGPARIVASGKYLLTETSGMNQS